MSSHFNYEIDERNLRVRLKDISLPYKEEAWIQFETYSDSCKQNNKANTLPRFQLNINRNVILPVIFGAVIILFSLLLFNFVSIKNTQSSGVSNNQETKVPVEQIVKKETPKKEVIPEVKPIETAIMQKADTAKVTLASITQPTVSETKAVTVQNNSIQVTPAANKNIAAMEEKKIIAAEPNPEKISQARAWTTTETAEIFSRPDNKSEVIGNSSSNRAYEAIEETNYYIKITFHSKGTQQIGYIKKLQLRKNSEMAQVLREPKKRRNRKAEIIEPLHTPVSLPTAAENREPELK